MYDYLEAAFQKPMRELRCALESMDSGCSNQHYTKCVDTLECIMQLKGHPLVCSNDGGCLNSQICSNPLSCVGDTFLACGPGNVCPND